MLQPKQNKTCLCHDNGLCLNIRYLSWVLSVIILLSFGFFMAGYFLGKRKAVQDLQVTLDQGSLADKIFTSLCTIQEHRTVVAQQENDIIESMDSSDLEYNTSQSIDVDIASVQSPIEASDHTEDELKTGVAEGVAKLPHKKYFAQLVGFGTQQAADAFAQRLQKNNIPVRVKDRHSKTAKGKKIIWYQVVTAPFSNKEELERVVSEIKIKERLKDVRIITC